MGTKNTFEMKIYLVITMKLNIQIEINLLLLFKHIYVDPLNHTISC